MTEELKTENENGLEGLDPRKSGSDLTPREEQFLEVLFTEAGGNIRRAMTLAGYAKATPEGQVVKKLQKQIIEKSKEYWGAHSAQAVMSLISVLSDPSAPGSDKLLKAVKEVLDRAHVGTEAPTTSTNEKNIFILPEKSKVTITTEE